MFDFGCNHRAMAICISLMMGRLGSVVGANIVGLLLDNYCQLAFSMTGALLICKYQQQLQVYKILITGEFQSTYPPLFTPNSLRYFGGFHTEYSGEKTNSTAERNDGIAAQCLLVIKHSNTIPPHLHLDYAHYA